MHITVTVTDPVHTLVNANKSHNAAMKRKLLMYIILVAVQFGSVAAVHDMTEGTLTCAAT